MAGSAAGSTLLGSTFDIVAPTGIAKLYGIEVVNGISATTYEPSASIVRAQAAAILARLHDRSPPSRRPPEGRGCGLPPLPTETALTPTVA